jgi:hypothetical protein
MPYVVGAPTLKVERPVGSGQYVELKKGDLVPEAPQWPTFNQNLRIGHVVLVQDGVPAEHAAAITDAQKNKNAHNTARK